MRKRLAQTAGGLLARLTVLFALLLGGCQPSPTPLPRATAQVITVRAAPALLALRDQFHSCAAEQPGIGIVVLELAQGGTPQPVDIELRWGAGKDPLSGFTAQLGLEELVVITHPSNPLVSITLADLKNIYQGSLLTWKEPASGEIEPWAYTGSNDDAQTVFETAVLGGSPIPQRIASTAPDAPAMLEAISSSPGAIGFIPRRWLDERVKVLVIEGIPADLLRQPILAVTNSEPEGPEKSWLLCLQEQLQ